MFDIGWSELLVIAVVAIIVIGPKELPRLMRTFGYYTGKLRRAAADFQRQFEEAVRESEIEEVRKAMHDFRDTSHSVNLEAHINRPLMTPNPPAPAAPPASMPVVSTPPSPKPKRKPTAKAVPAKAVPAKAVPAKTPKAKTAAAKPRQSKGRKA
jgi:sec-independent protein translocase protein TatB